MRLTIAFDDISLPLPPMASPDVRQLVIEEVVDMAAHAGVEDIELIAAIGLATPTFAAEPDWSQVAQALGKSGNVQAGGVYRVGFPRTDLNVSLDGLALRAGFALGGWVAFKPSANVVVIMLLAPHHAAERLPHDQLSVSGQFLRNARGVKLVGFLVPEFEHVVEIGE